MIVCVCNNISSKVLDAYREQGLGLDDVQKDFGLASNCGQCLTTAERLMQSPRLAIPGRSQVPEASLIAMSV